MTDTTAQPPRWTEYMPVTALVPAERNAKDHDPELLSASVDEFGFAEPVVLDERTGRLLAGHGRTEYLLAAEAAGAAPPEGIVVDDDGAWLVPVFRGNRSRDDEHAEAMGIALNRVGERGGWVEETLAAALQSLPEALLPSTGWTADELDDLLAGLQETTEGFGEDRSGGAYEENTYGDWAENYRNKQVRSMVFDYPLDDYAAVAEMATRARKAHGVESNAELFQRLLEAWSAANPA